MATPKIYRNLKGLPEKIIDRYTLYLQSPLHHDHPETLQLWLALRPYHPDYAIADEALFAIAFPDKPYDNPRLRVLRSYLFDHLEQCMVLLELAQSPLDRNRLLRNASERLGLPQLGNEAWQTVSGPLFFEPELALEEFILREDVLKAAVRHDNRSQSHDLNAVLWPLDVFYVVQRLKYLCALVDPITRSASLMDQPALQQVIALYHAMDMATQPLAAIYFHLLHLISNQEVDRHAAAMRTLLAAHHKDLDPIELLNIYTNWYNFLNFRLRSGAASATRDIFQLYQEMIALNALFDHGSFTANHFKNIIFIAAVLGEFEWAQTFLDQNHARLELPWRTGVRAYCQGYLLFAQGQYASAKRQLIGAEFYDAEYKLSHQLLFLQIYYETDDLEGLESVRDALKIYLYRSKDLHAIHKESAANFTRFVAKLFHLKGLQAPQKAAHKVLLQMQACPQLRARNWLAAKAAELIGR